MSKRKKKYKIKKSIKVVLGLFLLVILGSTIYYFGIKNDSSSTNKIISNKTYDEAKDSKYYNSKYNKAYKSINYIENKDFIKNITLLLDLGYTSTDINTFYKDLKDNIDIIINNEYNPNLSKYIKLSYFKKENLDRYLKYYSSNKDMSIKNIVTYVNIGIDKEAYTNTITVSNPSDLEVIVNKYNRLPDGYAPSDLVTLPAEYSYGTWQLRKEAANKFLELCKDAKKENLTLFAKSAYRSYEIQVQLYNKYVNEDGAAKADIYSARPRFSEHETGLAVDINLANEKFNSTSEYQWLIKNAYKYGFILRYPENKDNITGYEFEGWHYRYVGIETAEEIYTENITFDEYIARKKI